MNTEAIKILEERIKLLTSKRDRILTLISQFKSNAVLCSDVDKFYSLKKEADSISFTISEIKGSVDELRQQSVNENQ